MQPIIRVDLLF